MLLSHPLPGPFSPLFGDGENGRDAVPPFLPPMLGTRIWRATNPVNPIPAHAVASPTTPPVHRHHRGLAVRYGIGCDIPHESYGRYAIAPGAFSECLKSLRAGGRKPKLIFDHSKHKPPLGVYGKDFDLSEDEKGLWITDISLSLSQKFDAHRQYRELSPAFWTVYSEESRDEYGALRLVTTAWIEEISLVLRSNIAGSFKSEFSMREELASRPGA